MALKYQQYFLKNSNNSNKKISSFFHLYKKLNTTLKNNNKN